MKHRQLSSQVLASKLLVGAMSTTKMPKRHGKLVFFLISSLAAKQLYPGALFLLWLVQELLSRLFFHLWLEDSLLLHDAILAVT